MSPLAPFRCRIPSVEAPAPALAAALALLLAAALLLAPAPSATAQEPAQPAAPEDTPAAEAAAETAGVPAPEHAETLALVERVGAAVERVEAEGVEVACGEFKEPGSRWDPDGEGYVFVNDVEGNALCHPGRPGLEGRSVLGLRDPHGKRIVESFQRETADDGEGWVHYLWPKPPGSTFYWKTTYVRRAGTADGREVIVGSGTFDLPMERLFVVEQVDDAVALIEAQGEEAFPTLRDEASGFRFYDSYVFVMDAGGVHLVNAGFPEHEGRNMLEWTDENGKRPGVAMLELLAERDAGWVDYMWPRPGDQPASRKSTYVRRVDLPGGAILVVGAGLYED